MLKWVNIKLGLVFTIKIKNGVNFMQSMIKHIENMINLTRKIDLCKAFDFDVGMSEFIILNIISTIMNKEDKDSIGVSEIVSGTITSAQATSKCLNLLEQKGYITRFLSKYDKRRMQVSFTQKGKDRYEMMTQKVGSFMSDIVNGFSGNEYPTLVSLLNKFEDLYLDNLSKLKGEGALSETI